MPHTRSRYLETVILSALRHSPLVGVLGQRQTGKTTLVRQICGDGYLTLDDAEQLIAAREAPKAFLKRGRHPFAIDECQLAPELFPALKLHVQEHPRKGQFILTGSVRFSARKPIRESLTGRIQLLELHPMTIAEAQGREAPNLVREVTRGFRFFQKQVHERSRSLTLERALGVLETGGLPGICFFRDSAARRPRFASHLDTILGRDLKLVSETDHPVLKMRELLALLARHQGEPIAWSDLSRRARISTASLQKLVQAFEALFLIRRVLPVGDTRKDSFFLEDQGMATYLAPAGLIQSDLVRLVYSQVFPHLDLHDPGGVTVHRFETRNGALVPLVFQSAARTIGMIPIALESPDKKTIASARSFLRHEPTAQVLVLTRGSECLEYDGGLWVLPITGVL